jgi:hypothetical protein
MKKIKIEIYVLLPDNTIVENVASDLIDMIVKLLDAMVPGWKPSKEVGEPVRINISKEDNAQ